MRLFDPLHLLLVDIDEEVARLLEIDLRGEEGGGVDARVVLRRHPAERGGGERAADAIADDVDLRRPRRILRGLDGGEEALAHVVREAFPRLRSRRH
jgi:hypothetical protein